MTNRAKTRVSASQQAVAVQTVVPATATAASHPETKKELVLSLLQQSQGTTVAAIMEATGWQAHSVRGFLTSVVRQKLGLTLTSTIIDGKRTYHVVTAKPTKPRAVGKQKSVAAEAQV